MRSEIPESSAMGSACRFPNRIRSIRRLDSRLKLAEVARIIGVSRGHLECIEAGRKVPSAAILHDIASVLEVTVSELFEEAWARVRDARIQQAKAAILE